ncbi:MAG: Xaa-Pro aminopeptidase [Candidatus Dependentiae bacterium]|nr:Xaa-Pro aminopeptidase [Candidatus Dependentiae bacterium]
MKKDFSLYAVRRKDLAASVHQGYKTEGVIVLFAGFENERIRFRQESSFYYYTGITEPGAVAVIEADGKTTLWVPHTTTKRAQWVDADIPLIPENAKKFNLQTIRFLGGQSNGYQFHHFFHQEEYEYFIAFLQECLRNKSTIFTLNPSDATCYAEQRLILERLQKFVTDFSVQDISHFVHAARRRKDIHEIELLYRAVDITTLAQEAAARAIAVGVNEAEVQASLEYMMTGSQARIAFPSIVASGKNGTVLHYMSNNATLQAGDLVVVDIGAEHEYYCADITRTYPVLGIFSARQRELYTLVLQTQQYIANLAKPGYWLSNKEQPEKSLHHLAKKFLDDHGCGHYFVHGIGHFLGLDVHDVGNYKEPLQEGDVFTIEPGIYIPEENIGIRIEDNYWVAKDSVICLSEHLSKGIAEIESLMRESKEIEEEFSEEDENEIAH